MTSVYYSISHFSSSPPVRFILLNAAFLECWMIEQHKEKHQNRSVNYIGSTWSAINISKSSIICNKFWFMFTLVFLLSSTVSEQGEKLSFRSTLKAKRKIFKQCQIDVYMRKGWQNDEQENSFCVMLCVKKKNVKWSITMEMIYRKLFASGWTFNFEQ